MAKNVIENWSPVQRDGQETVDPNEDFDGFYFCSVTCILLLALSLLRLSIHTKTSLIVCWLGVLDIKGNGQLQCFDQYYEEWIP